jgi:DNA-binding transcriptional MerR regulator
MPAMLRSRDVLEIFGVCDRTLRRWEVRGILKPVRVGRTRFYSPDDISAILFGKNRMSEAPEPDRNEHQDQFFQ